MEIKFTKKDFWLAVLAGEIVAWLSLPTLKNLNILDILIEQGIEMNIFVFFWVISIPIASTLGLYFFYSIAKYKHRLGLLQLGKYGVIGVLNTFLSAGIYNFFIFATDISSGLAVDLFFIVAFVITVVNSFLWNRFWTFEEKGTSSIGKEAFQFFSVSGIVALINFGILHVIVNVIGTPAGMDSKIWANIGIGLTIITAFFGNFFGYKFFVFKK